MAKHIAFVYTHDIHGDKITESLKDIAVYSLIGLYMADAVKAELEEWLLSGDIDYLHKVMTVIRTAIEKEKE